ncbi:hypothetical protein [Pseudomonas sp. LD120]|uniref:hypothetical protein n=1 Tax=Pseudomonas sp. LD120 TaxID=485751 RepID=UPI0021157694|nr:hypothetical protein [Pseudomonas sp. LD120]
MAVEGEGSRHVQVLNIDLRGLPDHSTDQQNQAFVYRLLKTLKSGGWQTHYFPSEPRIPGAQWHKLDGQESLLGMTPLSHPLFDAGREMSLKEWLGVSTFYDWYRYQGDFIAHVRPLRSDSKSAPLETGVYLISLNLMSLGSFWATIFAEEQRAHWKALLPAHLQALLQRRSQAETRARAAGVNIEQSYAHRPSSAASRGRHPWLTGPLQVLAWCTFSGSACRPVCADTWPCRHQPAALRYRRGAWGRIRSGRR